MRWGNGDQARRLLSGKDFALCLCRAVGLAVPPSIFAGADEAIE